MNRLGAYLCLVLGTVLLFGGLSATTAGGGVGQPFPCGQAIQIGLTVPSCQMGTFQVTKVVTGTRTPPPGGWTVTIASSNCTIFPGTQTTLTLPAAGGTVSSGALYASIDGADTTACDYTLAETAVAGWTTTQSPSGTLTLPTNQAHAPTVVSVTFTNTGRRASSTPPATHSASASQASATPSATTGALATTGNRRVRLTTVAGIALLLLGVGLLFAGRRGRPARG